jgi:PIN domain nuclease of toxin-antitoxin system
LIEPPQAGSASPKAIESLLSNPPTERLVNSASLVEITMSASGKIVMNEVDVRKALRGLVLIPFTSQHAFRMFSMPLHHRDPFDWMIIATALAE